MQEKLPLWRRIVKIGLGTLLTIVLLAAFYIAVVMGNPQEEGASTITARLDQPLLDAMSSPILIREQGQLDVPFENGLGRRVTLTYRTAEGASVTVVSLYPARTQLTKDDYAFSATTGLPLAGLRSVRMENAANIRMHAQGTDALYIVTLPPLDASGLRTLTSTLQLYQGD